MRVQHADVAGGESPIGLDPASGPGDLVDRTTLCRLGEFVQHLDRLGCVEGGFLQVGSDELYAVHREQRPVQPVEVERHEARRGVAAGHLLRKGEYFVEVLWRRAQAGLGKHRLVVEQQCLGDVERHHVVLPFEHPVAEVVRVVAAADCGFLLEQRRQVKQCPLRCIFQAQRPLSVDDVGGRASG